MVFSESPDKIYWCIPVGEPIISHQGTQGFVTMNFRCHAPWATSPIFSSPIYDLTSNPLEGTIVEIVNNGDLPMPLLINVEIISDSSFSIQNLSDSGKTLSMTGLDVNEILEINTSDESVSTSKLLTYRYDQFSGEYLFLIRGVNRLLIKGNIKLQMQYELLLLQS
jgi:phage-related protein